MIQLLVDSNNRVPFLDQANLLNMLIYHLEKYEDLCRNCPREENPREQSVGIAKVKELVQKLSNRIIQTDNQN